MPTINQPPPVTSSNTLKTFSFPFGLGQSGFPAMADPNTAIYNSILSLLTTGKNERVMHPDFGVNIHALIFENLTPLLQARIAMEVTRAIELYEPRVAVIGVSTRSGKTSDGEDTVVFCDILYRVVGQEQAQQVEIPLTGSP